MYPEIEDPWPPSEGYYDILDGEDAVIVECPSCGHLHHDVANDQYLACRVFTCRCQLNDFADMRGGGWR